MATRPARAPARVPPFRLRSVHRGREPLLDERLHAAREQRRGSRLGRLLPDLHDGEPWNRKLFLGLEVLGWVTIIAIFALSERLIGQPFALNRRDDILPLLAFAALAGILIWRFTRTNHAIRLGILAAIVALRLASSSAGWVQELWSFSPAPWLFDWGTLDLLIIIIPGTIVGDALVEWMRTPLSGAGEQGWPAWRLRALAGLSVAIQPTLVLGLYFRQPLATTAIVAALGGAMVYLIREARLPGERLVARILSWGLFWVFLGLLLEPLEGGINKVPGSILYYMTTGGNAMCLIAALTIVLDLLGVWRRYARPVAEVGENPLVGYMLMPALRLSAARSRASVLTRGGNAVGCDREDRALGHRGRRARELDDAKGYLLASVTLRLDGER